MVFYNQAGNSPLTHLNSSRRHVTSGPASRSTTHSSPARPVGERARPVTCGKARSTPPVTRNCRFQSPTVGNQRSSNSVEEAPPVFVSTMPSVSVLRKRTGRCSKPAVRGVGRTRRSVPASSNRPGFERALGPFPPLSREECLGDPVLENVYLRTMTRIYLCFFFGEP